MTPAAMFPLGTVLFPHTPLPLRIFEPRYLMMLGQLLEQSEPEFGVVLIERGSEAGGGDRRLTIGTMARIIHVETGDGDIQLVAVGRQRISVTEWLSDDPYPRAHVEVLPDLVWTDAHAPLLAQAEQVVRRVLSRAAEYGETRWDASTEISEEPIEAAWQLAAIAPLSEWDQFRLLRARTIGELLGALIDLTLEAEPGLTAAGVADDLDAGLEQLIREESGGNNDEDDDQDDEDEDDAPSPRD